MFHIKHFSSSFFINNFTLKTAACRDVLHFETFLCKSVGACVHASKCIMSDGGLGRKDATPFKTPKEILNITCSSCSLSSLSNTQPVYRYVLPSSRVGGESACASTASTHASKIFIEKDTIKSWCTYVCKSKKKTVLPKYRLEHVTELVRRSEIPKMSLSKKEVNEMYVSDNNDIQMHGERLEKANHPVQLHAGPGETSQSMVPGFCAEDVPSKQIESSLPRHDKDTPHLSPSARKENDIGNTKEYTLEDLGSEIFFATPVLDLCVSLDKKEIGYDLCEFPMTFEDKSVLLDAEKIIEKSHNETCLEANDNDNNAAITPKYSSQGLDLSLSQETTEDLSQTSNFTQLKEKQKREDMQSQAYKSMEEHDEDMSMGLRCQFSEDADRATKKTKHKKEKKPMLTHFLALQIHDAKIQAGLKEVQQEIVKKERILEKAMVSVLKAHLTVEVLSLQYVEDRERAKMCLAACADQITSLLQNELLFLEVKGIGSFNNKVVFANISAGKWKDDLNLVADIILKNFESFPGTENKFKPHITIAKLSKDFHFFRKKGVRKIDPDLYSQYQDKVFGHQIITSIQLCSMTGNPMTGYYEILHELPVVPINFDKWIIKELSPDKVKLVADSLVSSSVNAAWKDSILDSSSRVLLSDEGTEVKKAEGCLQENQSDTTKSRSMRIVKKQTKRRNKKAQDSKNSEIT